MQPAANYYSTQKVWNDATKNERIAILAKAGHNKNTFYYERAFAYIPQHVRLDIISAQARGDVAPIPPPPTNHAKPKQTWQPYKD